MVSDSKNRKATKAMVAIEKRFGVDSRTAVITKDEFEDIGNYILYLEDFLVEVNGKAYRTETADLTNDETQDVCPGCGGVADNGYDRSWPEPNPYYCTKCESGIDINE